MKFQTAKKTIFRSLAFAFLTLAVCSCRTKPNEAECIQSLENFLRLTMEGDPGLDSALESAHGPASAKLARKCVENKTRKRVLCEINAKRLPDLSDCTAL